jgi:hypothetical protein
MHREGDGLCLAFVRSDDYETNRVFSSDEIYDCGSCEGSTSPRPQTCVCSFADRSASRIWLSTVRKHDMHIESKLPFSLDR